METELLDLDPLFKTPIKILIKHILTLKKSEHESFEIYHFHDHLVQFVDICAFISGVERDGLNVIYTLDDLSDIIPCILWNDSTKNRPDTLKLGALVRVLGSIRTYNEKKQISIDTITELHDPIEKALHHIQIAKLQSEYRKPWTLPHLVKYNKNQLLERPTSNSPGTDLKAQEETFIISVYSFLSLNSPNAPFPFSFALLDEQSIKLAKKMIPSKALSSSEIYKLFEKAIMAICKNGMAKRCDNAPGMYELIDRMALINFIMSTVTNAPQNMSTDQGGVRLDYIQTCVSKEFSELDNDDISRAVNNLCARGLLYCCGHKEYKLQPLTFQE